MNVLSWFDLAKEMINCPEKFYEAKQERTWMWKLVSFNVLWFIVSNDECIWLKVIKYRDIITLDPGYKY